MPRAGFLSALLLHQKAACDQIMSQECKLTVVAVLVHFSFYDQPITCANIFYYGKKPHNSRNLLYNLLF